MFWGLTRQTGKTKSGKDLPEKVSIYLWVYRPERQSACSIESQKLVKELQINSLTVRI